MSLLTNASAQVALQTLRSVQGSLQETQSRISTGLEVRSPKDNPSFFLVAQTVRGDLTVLEGLRDNLTIGINATKLAGDGLNGATDIINDVQKALSLAQSGSALNEVQLTINELVGQIEGNIDGTNFNGVNLLKGTDATTITTTVIRDAGSFNLQTFTLLGQNLDNLELAGVGTDFYGPTGTPADLAAAQAVAETQFDALYRAFNSGLGSRVDSNGNGTVDLTAGAAGGTDDVLGAAGAANTFNFFGTDDDVEFLASIGITANNIGNVVAGDSRSVIEIELNTALTANAPSDYIATKAAGPQAAANNGVAFADAATLLQEAVFSDANLREFANDSGFRAVARQIEVANTDAASGTTANIQAGFVLADSLIARVNIAQTTVGIFESTLSSRQNFLDNLTDSLELGVAALVEADLDEESSRLQSLQVQEQLAIQALQIANQRPQNILSLFR